MTTRELWQQIMHYGEFDRMPVIHWAGWTETKERWIREGMPRGVDEHQYFNAVPWMAGISINEGLHPKFDVEVIEETNEYVIRRETDGVVCQSWKGKSCIPHFINFTLKTAADWPEYKKRLQPDPARIPDNLDEHIRNVEASGNAVGIRVGSLMGWIRNWMGVENMAYLMYDDPDCYADMVDTLSDLFCWAVDQIVARMHTTPDIAHGWEDICFRTGPLVSPALFEKCVAPGYRKVRRKLDEHGIEFYSIDSDGLVEPLVGHWLDAGVNVQFPIEIGAWNADPHAIRRRFGKELRIIGGYNKLALERGRAEIDAELERRLPLMKEGGFILMPDHLITPGVPLDDYKYYLGRVRALRF